MTSYKVSAILICFAFLLFINDTNAQPSKVDDLQKRVKALEKRVAKLERTVEQMKTNPVSSTESNTPPVTEAWKAKENWRRLKKGMSEQDVIEGLGDPPKVSTGTGVNLWFYGNFGSVTFDADSRTLTGWDEPSGL